MARSPEADASLHRVAADPTQTNPIPSLRSVWLLLVLESLFSVVGGFLDAYAFIAHGHVFANAQTGNVVYFAMYATSGNWPDAVRYIPSIVACILGVSAGKLLGSRTEKHTFRATLVCQCVELVVLAFLTVYASVLPSTLVVPIISFVAALQITSFAAIGSWTFNTAMTTGNLRSATTAFVLWVRGQNPSQNRGKAIVSSLACLSFFFGAILGGFCTRRHQAHALLPCVALTFVGFLLTLHRHLRNTTNE